ncbi:MAG: hypothetical protein ACREBS_05980 [Nitrososphaerales archaeon]
MSDLDVSRGGMAKLDRVDGALTVGNRARLESTSGKIMVTGSAYFEGDARINCDFECNSLKVGQSARHGGSLKVNGNLVVHNKLEVSRSLNVEKELRAEEIDVAGRIEADTLVCKRVKVGGVLTVKTRLESSELVDVGWKAEIPGTVKLHDLAVGGLADIGGGSISGTIEARMKFNSRLELEFGELRVFGKATLPANCKGRKISTFGKLLVDGNISCEEIQIEGVTEVQGNCESSRIEVNGKLEVSGSLSATDKIEIHGSTNIVDELRGASLQVAGKLATSKIIISGETNIMGVVETKQGLKAKSIVIGSGSRCEGPLVGEQRVEVGKSEMNVMAWGTKWAGQRITMRMIGRPTRVQDVYGTFVYLREFTTAARVFAQNVELEKGCLVDQILYSGEVKMPGDDKKCVYINHMPEKVEKLPSPPL